MLEKIGADTRCLGPLDLAKDKKNNTLTFYFQRNNCGRQSTLETPPTTSLSGETSCSLNYNWDSGEKCCKALPLNGFKSFYF